MISRFGEDLWYLLTLFQGMGYMVLFVLLMIWIRLLLKVFEDALMPRRKTSHKFVHPIPLPPSLTRSVVHDSVVPDEHIEDVELIANDQTSQDEDSRSIGMTSYYSGPVIRGRQLTSSTTRRMLG